MLEFCVGSLFWRVALGAHFQFRNRPAEEEMSLLYLNCVVAVCVLSVFLMVPCVDLWSEIVALPERSPYSIDYEAAAAAATTTTTTNSSEPSLLAQCRVANSHEIVHTCIIYTDQLLKSLESAETNCTVSSSSSIKYTLKTHQPY